MSRKIYGNTVGTPLSPQKIKEIAEKDCFESIILVDEVTRQFYKLKVVNGKLTMTDKILIEEVTPI